MLFVGVGVGLVVFAIVELVRAWRGSFVDASTRARSTEPHRRVAVSAIGRVGLAGRALVFGAGGVMLARCALRARADTIGTGDILRHLFGVPFGQPVVAVVAVGLFAFAAYLATQAAWRRSVVRWRAQKLAGDGEMERQREETIHA